MYERHLDFEADLVLAQDPKTDEKLFSKLLRKHHGDIEMTKALAQNPSCPRQLFTAFWRYIRHIAEKNPAVKKYQAHEHWQNAIRNTPRVRYSPYSSDLHTGYPQIHALLYILEHGDGNYQRLAMAIENIPENLVREQAETKSAPMRKVIAGRQTAPADVFETLSKDSARTVRQVVAANPNAPAEVVANLATDADDAVARAARENPVCPDEAVHQARLAEAGKPSPGDQDFTTLKFSELTRLAANPETDGETLRQLAAHEDPCVRFLAGINPGTPTATLAQLAEDSVTWVRSGAAFNPNTFRETLTTLLSSADPDVQVGLASNPGLPEANQLQLAEIACDKAGQTLANLTRYPSVWAKLAENVEPAKKVKDKTWRHFLVEILKQTAAGKFVGLQHGPKSRNLFAARIAARAETCPAELACHYAYYVFDDYSQNQEAALALLEGKTHVEPVPYRDWKLDKWLSEAYAPGLVSNYYARSDVQKRRTQAASNSTTELLYLLPMVLDDNTVTRKRLAQRKDLNRFMFEILARDEKSGVREAIVNNKHRPKGLLGRLAEDKSTAVRAAVGKRSRGAKLTKTEIVNRGAATERARLAKNSEERALLEELSDDRAMSVRLAVANNRETPSSIMAKLARDKETKVRLAVAGLLADRKALKYLLTDRESEVRLRAAKNWRWRSYEGGKRVYDPEFLAFIADAREAEIRAIAAEHTDDQAVLKKHMNDVSLVTQKLPLNEHFSKADRLTLAKNTDDQDTLSALARNADNVQLFLLAAGKITSSDAAGGVSSNKTMFYRSDVRKVLRNHPLESVRRSIAIAEMRNPATYVAKEMAREAGEWIKKVTGGK